MATKKSTKVVASIDIDALIEKRFNIEKEELRQQVFEEQLSKLLQSTALREATLREFLEQLKNSSQELWKIVSAKPILEIAHIVSGANLLEKHLKKQRRPTRWSLTATELDEHKTRLLGFLTSSEEGQAAEQISTALSLDPNVVKLVLLKLRASKQVTTQGKKRSTRYLLA
jgi:hypothetical protein